MDVLGFIVVALASAAISALLVYVAEEWHHEHLNHPKGKL